MRRGRHDRPPLDTEDDAPGELELLLGGVRGELRGLLDDFKRALRVEWLRAKVGTVDLLAGAVFYLALFGFGIVLVVASAVHLAMALRESLGPLGAGLSMFGCGLAVIVGVRTWLRRQGVRRARRTLNKETEIEDEI